MKTLFLISISIIIGLSSCDKENDNSSISGNDLIVLDKDMYDTVSTSNYSILNAEIIDNCLKVEVYSGGCDGSSWEVTLVDSELVAESNITERFIKISLKNEELCLAMVVKTYTFDLTPIKFSNNQIFVNLSNWENKLLYQY